MVVACRLVLNPVNFLSCRGMFVLLELTLTILLNITVTTLKVNGDSPSLMVTIKASVEQEVKRHMEESELKDFADHFVLSAPLLSMVWKRLSPFLSPLIAADGAFIIYSIVAAFGVLAGDDFLVLHFITCIGATVLLLGVSALRLVAVTKAADLLAEEAPRATQRADFRQILQDNKNVGMLEAATGLVFFVNVIAICLEMSSRQRRSRHPFTLKKDEIFLVFNLCFVLSMGVIISIMHYRLMLADRDSFTKYNYQLSFEGQMCLAVMCNMLVGCSGILSMLLGDTFALMIPMYEALLGVLLLFVGIPVLNAGDRADFGKQVIFTRTGQGQRAKERFRSAATSFGIINVFAGVLIAVLSLADLALRTHLAAVEEWKRRKRRRKAKKSRQRPQKSEDTKTYFYSYEEEDISDEYPGGESLLDAFFATLAGRGDTRTRDKNVKTSTIKYSGYEECGLAKKIKKRQEKKRRERTTIEGKVLSLSSKSFSKY